MRPLGLVPPAKVWGIGSRDLDIARALAFIARLPVGKADMWLGVVGGIPDTVSLSEQSVKVRSQVLAHVDFSTMLISWFCDFGKHAGARSGGTSALINAVHQSSLQLSSRKAVMDLKSRRKVSSVRSLLFLSVPNKLCATAEFRLKL